MAHELFSMVCTIQLVQMTEETKRMRERDARLDVELYKAQCAHDVATIKVSMLDR